MFIGGAIVKHIKVLAIDGGGIRGIIPAMVLAQIEQMTSRPVSQLFDLISGTSTGGILSLLLTRPSDKNDNTPAYSASDIIDFYTESGRLIFSADILHKIVSMNGIADERYPYIGIESALKRYLGEYRLSSALTSVLIPSYEIGLRTPFFFKSWNARKPGMENYDFTMWQVARAASAAPTYFEPCRIELDDAAEVDYYSLIDGGVFANNPAMCAYAEARALYGSDNVLMLSLGTGILTRSIPYNQAKNWGLAMWAKPVLDIMFDGVSSTVDYQLKQLLPADNYYRIQASLAELGNDDMDDAGKENIHELKLLGQRLIEEWQRNGKLEKLCLKLTA